jgi:hypothetical protein
MQESESEGAADDDLFQQVELRRKRQTAIAWIPARAAKVGNEFALRDDEDIWRVVEVTPFVLTQDQLHRMHRDPKETLQ